MKPTQKEFIIQRIKAFRKIHAGPDSGCPFLGQCATYCETIFSNYFRFIPLSEATQFQIDSAKKILFPSTPYATLYNYCPCFYFSETKVLYQMKKFFPSLYTDSAKPGKGAS